VIKRVSFPVYVKVANLGGSVDCDMSYDVLCVVCKVAWDCVLGSCSDICIFECILCIVVGW
jgi:hypothetical protein